MSCIERQGHRAWAESTGCMTAVPTIVTVPRMDLSWPTCSFNKLHTLEGGPPNYPVCALPTAC